MMIKLERWSTAVAAGAALLSLGVADGAVAQSSGALPKVMVIAVARAGTSLNAIGTGIAKLMGEKTGSKMRVRVGNALDGIVGAGEVDFGMSAGTAAHEAFNGLARYRGKPQKDLRLAMPGPALIIGFIVKKDAPYRTVVDLKGKPVPSEFPNLRPVVNDGRAMFRTADMTWNDIAGVPVNGFRENFQAFIEGRTEAAFASVGMGFVRQADAKLKGIRFLGLPAGPDTSRKLWEAEPGFYAVSVKKGSAVGIDRDMVLAAKDIYVTANKNTSEEAVYTLAKLIWNDVAELNSVHPVFKRWTRDRMRQGRVTIPFHAGTVRFLKEMGAWTAEHEATQNQLVAKTR